MKPAGDSSHGLYQKSRFAMQPQVMRRDVPAPACQEPVSPASRSPHLWALLDLRVVETHGLPDQARWTRHRAVVVGYGLTGPYGRWGLIK
jgi:hypothetical protein